MRYLLVDQQVDARGSETAHYIHDTRQLVDARGVTEGAQISVTFDPSYQELTFHHLSVHRGAEVLDRLEGATVQLLQREPGSHRQIYDGTLTLHIIPHDVRPGDVVDYAYTIRGRNPILGGRLVTEWDLQWRTPVSHVHYRLLWPGGRPPLFRTHAGELQPRVAEVGDATEYTWEQRNVPALDPPGDTPAWHWSFPWLQVTAFHTWQEVAQWAHSLYLAGMDAPPEVLAIIPPPVEGETTGDRVARLLHWVQEEVRYLGIEFGVKSYTPYAPARVLAQRFGDCKDKSLLLVSMLRAIGVEAWPMLVNTSVRSAVQRLLPSPTAFDHVIVMVRVDGESFWLDPTLQHQAGNLYEHSLANYGYGLPVHPDAEALVPMPLRPEARSHTSATYRYDLSREPAWLDVETVFRGAAAERQRATLSTRTPEKMQEEFRGYYESAYPGIRVREPLDFEDDRSANEIVSIERYEVPDPWEREAGLQSAFFTPMELQSLVEPPDASPRSAPLFFSHPVEQHVHFDVTLPGPWEIPVGDAEQASPAFVYTSSIVGRGNHLELDYRFRSLLDHVPAAALQQHHDAMLAAQNDLTFQIWQPTEASLDALHWPNVLLALLAVLGCLWLAARLYRYDPEPATHLPMTHPRIGGWLLLVGFTLLGAPFRETQTLLEVLDSTLLIGPWNNATTPGAAGYVGGLGLVLLFELFAEIALIVFSLVVLALFFQRRHTAPRALIWLFAVSLVIGVTDTILSVLLDLTEVGKAVVTSIGQGLGAVVWISYFQLSGRVRGTFVLRRPGHVHVPTDPQPAASPEVASEQ